MRAPSSYLLDELGNVEFGKHDFWHESIAESSDDAMRAIKSLGHIEWLVRPGHVRLRFRPSMVSPGACRRVMTWLESERPERILLSYLVCHEWEYEFCRTSREAAARIRDLLEQYGGGRYCNARRRMAPAALISGSGRSREALLYWRQNCREFQGTQTLHTLDPLLSGRWLLYEKVSSGFKMVAFGAGNSGHVRRWARTQLGHLQAQDADSLFSASCTEVFRAAAHTFAPSVEAIDAVAHWPGYGRRRSRFNRLLLPFEGEERTWLLSAIELDPTIDLLE